MRTVVIVFGLVCLMGAIRAQSVGIGTNTPDPSARLDVSDNRRGILIPRLTTAERNAITNPAHSLLIYNTDCNEYQYYIDGTGWVSILTSVTAGGGGSGTLTAYSATGIWAGALSRTGRRSQGLPAMRSESIRTAAPAPRSPRRPSQLGVPLDPYR
jgi:hypothetical protein